MRCDCPNCGAYMAHAQDLALGCICPVCKTRCNACLGTNTVLTREQLRAMEPPEFDPQKEELPQCSESHDPRDY